MAKATISDFGLQAGTDRTVFAKWTWNTSNTEHYEVKWVYATNDGKTFIGNKTTVTDNEDTYSAPDNAVSVTFYVKPISKTYSVESGGTTKEVSYWTAEWSTAKTYNFSDNPPTTPPIPTVTIEDYTLTAKFENLNLNAGIIFVEVVKDNSTVFKTGTITITTSYASYSCTVDAGGEYKVRARSYRSGMYSGWSDYSSNATTKPAASSGITSLKALSETSVQIDWASVSNADSYEIQYTTKTSYFDSSSEVQSASVESVVTHAEITGLTTGEEWFFRVRAVNDQGESAWTSIKSIKIGTEPAAPTTWSSTTTVVVGESLTLYWVHNSQDGSSQTYATLELIIDGVTESHVIQNSTDEDEKDKTSKYVVDTSGYTEGVKIQWRVKTRGILSEYSDWSVQRVVDIYAPPTLALEVKDSDGNSVDNLTSLPVYISGTASPNTQTPITYHVVVIANETYETVDNIGNEITIKTNDEIYSRHYDTSEELYAELSANDISLANNVSYTIMVTVSMNSGLKAEAKHVFTVAWDDDEYWPNAEVIYDKATVTTSISPYCKDENNTLIPGVILSVYRREFDGSFTELATGLNNTDNVFITDPHPALDYARYRIVAKASETGRVSYYDFPSIPIREVAAIIQWDEAWSNFKMEENDIVAEPVWSGSLLRLPYNIDVADKHDIDVELIEYIGRKYPVSYYGTQLGETSTWNMDIAKDDKDTLYALRRLAIWMGDVYVREPSGTGYWARVNVSFSQKHLDVVIPVTLDITRVEGGA